MEQTQKDMIDKVKEVILKQDWIQDHNIEFGNYSIYFSNLEKEVIVSETQMNINHYMRTYTENGQDFLEKYMTQQFPYRFYHHELTAEDIVEIIKQEVQGDN